MCSMSTVLRGGLCLLVLATVSCDQSQKRDDDVAPHDRAADSARPGTADRIGWNVIHRGMKPDEVLSLLDEPITVRVTRTNTYWYYSQRAAEGPQVVFGTRDMTVDSWRRP